MGVCEWCNIMPADRRFCETCDAAISATGERDKLIAEKRQRNADKNDIESAARSGLVPMASVLNSQLGVHSTELYEVKQQLAEVKKQLVELSEVKQQLVELSEVKQQLAELSEVKQQLAELKKQFAEAAKVKQQDSDDLDWLCRTVSDMVQPKW
jgi:DNA repair exonuclease SbcCD ATPase subunit